MNVKKTVKKIVALGAGATIMGATVLGAMAADLADLPAPFVKDGAYDALIVVGAKASTADVIGAVDIATRLQFENKVKAAASDVTTTVTITGDAARIEDSNNFLEIGEAIEDVADKFTEAELPVLKGGSVDGVDYTEEIEVGAGAGQVAFGDSGNDNDNDRVAHLALDKASPLYTYTVEFKDGLTSDLDTNTLSDIEDEQITLLGKTYTITKAEVVATDIFTFELLGGATSNYVEEGDSVTVSHDGIEYEITVSSIYTSDSKSKARLTVSYDGKSETIALEENDTDKLSNDIEFGANDIAVIDSNNAKSWVEFYIGSNKIEFTTAASGAKADVTINDEKLSELQASVKYTGTHGDANMDVDKIIFEASSDEDYEIVAGKKLSDYLDNDEMGILFEGALDVAFEGLTTPTVEEFTFKQGTDDYTLEMTNQDSVTFKFPVIYAVDATPANSIMGDDEGVFNTVFDTDLDLNAIPGIAAMGDGTAALDAITLDDEGEMFVVSSSDATMNDKSTYVVKYDNFDVDVDALNTDVEFDLEILGGDTITVNGFTFVDTGVAGLTVGDYLTQDVDLGDVDNVKFVYELTNVDGTGDLYVYETTNALADSNKLVTDNGVVLALAEAAGVSTVVFTADTDLFDTHVSAETFTLSFATDADEEVIFSGSAGDITLATQSGDNQDDDIETGLSEFGSYLEHNTDNTPNDVELTIPKAQAEAKVYLTSGAFEAVETTVGGDDGSYAVNKVSVGAAKLDTEVADTWENSNVIVVGGPCANSVAAALLNNPAECGAGFEPNKAVIKLFERESGKVAMLVAGYEAADTVRASKVVAAFDEHSLTGMEVEVAGTSMSDIEVTSVMN